MFSSFDSNTVSFQSDVIARMFCALTGRDDAYQWPAPKGFDNLLSALKTDWAARLRALIQEQAEDRQWWYENQQEEYLRHHPNTVKDGKVDQSLFDQDLRDALLLIEHVTEPDLLKVANSALTKTFELMQERLFEVIDAGDRFSSSSLGEETRKVFDAGTQSLLRDIKARLR